MAWRISRRKLWESAMMLVRSCCRNRTWSSFSWETWTLGTKWQQAPIIAGASSKSAVLTRELALQSASMVRVVRSSGAYDLPFTVQWQHGALWGNTYPASPSFLWLIVICDNMVHYYQLQKHSAVVLCQPLLHHHHHHHHDHHHREWNMLLASANWILWARQLLEWAISIAHICRAAHSFAFYAILSLPRNIKRSR